jgi:hypothetical protein
MDQQHSRSASRLGEIGRRIFHRAAVKIERDMEAETRQYDDFSRPKGPDKMSAASFSYFSHNNVASISWWRSISMIRSFIFAAFSAGALVGGGGTAFGQPAAPGDPAARAAFDVLEKHCARCHQPDRRAVDRPRPSRGPGNILDLAQLSRDRYFVQPGNPQASLIMKMMLDQFMPYDFYQELDDTHPEPTKEEIAVVAKWIESLGER